MRWMTDEQVEEEKYYADNSISDTTKILNARLSAILHELKLARAVVEALNSYQQKTTIARGVLHALEALDSARAASEKEDKT